MCDGLSTGTMLAISMAMSAASATAGYMHQNAVAEANASYQKRQADAYNEAAEQNAKIANSEYIEQAAAENIKMLQSAEAASDEMFEARKERMEKAGTALASSEAAGANLSFLLADFERQEARYRDTILTQLDMVGVQRDITIEGLHDTALNRGKSQQSYNAAPVNRPSIFGSLASFGSSSFSAYDKYTDGGKNSLKFGK